MKISCRLLLTSGRAAVEQKLTKIQNSPKIKIRRKYKTWAAWRKAQNREYHDIYQKTSKETGRRRLGCLVFVYVMVQRIGSLAAKKTKRKSTKSAQKSQDKATKIDKAKKQRRNNVCRMGETEGSSNDLST